jgi:hypothetical protein
LYDLITMRNLKYWEKNHSKREWNNGHHSQILKRRCTK